jgi:hypothetical protein
MKGRDIEYEQRRRLLAARDLQLVAMMGIAGFGEDVSKDVMDAAITARNARA